MSGKSTVRCPEADFLCRVGLSEASLSTAGSQRWCAVFYELNSKENDLNMVFSVKGVRGGSQHETSR